MIFVRLISFIGYHFIIDYLYLSVDYFVEQQLALIKRNYFSLNIQYIITKCRLSEDDSVAPLM